MFHHKIWIWVSKQLIILRWFRNCWEKCEKYKKVISKKRVQNCSLSSSILLTCKSFWPITYYLYTCFQLNPRIWNQYIFWYSYVKKETKILATTWMQIRNRWLNQLNSSSCENHCNPLRIGGTYNRKCRFT